MPIDYDAEKCRVENLFGRTLSDKEFAEALLGKIDCLESDAEAKDEDLSETRRMLSEYSSRPMVSDSMLLLSKRIEEIMDIPAECHTIDIHIKDDEDPYISFQILGLNPEKNPYDE